MEAATACGQVTLLAIILAHLSAGYLLAGRSEDASDLARRALALCRDNKERSFQAGAEDLGMRPLQAHCHLDLGMLYAETGQREQARAELSAAIEMYRSMAMQFWIPQMAAALVQMKG